MRSLLVLTSLLAFVVTLNGCCCGPMGYSGCVTDPCDAIGCAPLGCGAPLQGCLPPKLPTPSSYGMDVGMAGPSCGCSAPYGSGCVDVTCAAPVGCAAPVDPGCGIPNYAVPSGCDCGACSPAIYDAPACSCGHCGVQQAGYTVPHVINPGFIQWLFGSWWKPNGWGCAHNAYVPTYYEVSDIAGYPDPTWQCEPHAVHHHPATASDANQWQTPEPLAVPAAPTPAPVPKTPMPIDPTPDAPVPNIEQMSWQQPAWAPPQW